jgi:hypothetical protein
MGLAMMVLTVLIDSLASFVLRRMRLRGSRDRRPRSRLPPTDLRSHHAGFDTADLIAVKQLLDDLGAAGRR